MNATHQSSMVRVVLLLCVVAFCALAHGQVIYVDDDATGANDGTSWSNAYVYLQDALADANNAEKPVEIRVAKGIYKPDQGAGVTPGDRVATFHLINGITLAGGYAGVGEPDPNAWDIEVYETILSGDINGDDVNVADPCDLMAEPSRAENCYYVVTGSGNNATAVLNGFTVTGGNNTNAYPYDQGSGILNKNGCPTLINCTFTRNSASEGGGMFHKYGAPSVTNCTFSRNYGGGLQNDCGDMTLTNCIFSENCGRGMKNEDDCIITNSTFSRNSRGGMSNYGRPTLTNCVFSQNRAYQGGGMFGEEAWPRLNNCLFIGNVAERNGGAMFNDESNPRLNNCLFVGNVAGCGGGAICSGYESSLGLTNCLFAGNSAEQGGAIYNGSDTWSSLTKCTFAGNSAKNGNAIACNHGRSAVILNCILWDGSEEIWNNDSSGIRIRHSDVWGSWPGEGNIDGDPCFVDPGYWDPNGTPDDPNDDFWVNGDYHLKSEAGRWDPVSESWVIDDVTSPCIDAGDPGTAVAFEPFPNGAIVNMGAYAGTAEASKSPSGLHAQYGGGTGEPYVPYLIYTAEHLNAIGAKPNDWDKRFQLMADIDLSGYSYDRAVIAPNVNDTESDSQGIAFTGVFDGNGHTISHLTVSGAKTLGLFGYIGEGGRVKSLGIEGVTIAGTDFSGELGGLAGYNEGEITDCYATGRVTGGADAADLGGLVGYNLGGTVANCFAACTVAGGTARQDEAKHLGGLVGWNDWGVISNCYATGDVTAGDESGALGGLVGCNEQGTVTDCHATGTVTGGDDSRSLGGLVGSNGDDVETGVITDCYASGDVIGGNAAESLGGLVGSNHDATISGCYATGTVTGRDSCSQLGGLVGDNEGNVTCCCALGDVVGGNNCEWIGGLAGSNGGERMIRESYAAGSVRAGSDSRGLAGLVGRNEGGDEEGHIRNCYSRANVTAGAGSEEIGGLVGRNDGGDDPGRVRHCYSTGAVTVGASSDAIGGLVGDNLGSIRDSFWDTETSGLNAMCGRQDTHAHDCDDANGKTTAEMQTAATFLEAGWDFVGETANGSDDIWWILEGQDYPRLWWELHN